MFAPGEHEGGDRSRATDPIWSMEIYDIARSVMTVHQSILYYVTEGSGQRQPPRRSFVREELQVVPKDTGLPPDHVLERYNVNLPTQMSLKDSAHELKWGYRLPR